MVSGYSVNAKQVWSRPQIKPVGKKNHLEETETRVVQYTIQGSGFDRSKVSNN